MADKTPPAKRSPNYPVISLKSALDYAEKLRRGAKHHWVPIKTAVEEYWKLKITSSFTARMIGALRAFGLVEVKGKGDRRQLRVTDEAAKILSGHSGRSALLREAALGPGVHRAVWDHYAASDGLPPDPILREYLLWEHDPHFNEQKVDDFIEELRQTLAFAGVSESAIIDDENDDGDAEESHDSDPAPHPQKKGQRKLRTGEGQLDASITLLGDGDFQVVGPLRVSKGNEPILRAWIESLVAQITAVPTDAGEGDVDDNR